jgi:2-C-methyl-D-erythritol 2,4-cyclodiphosphate synthase
MSGRVRWPRVGLGWDVHPYAEGRPLVLAGVEITRAFGPVGHSDGDPLAHAVVDALLGAAALGDIGSHFPDDDERWRGAAGVDLLRRARAAVLDAGWQPAQVDAVLVCDRPRLAPHREAVRAALAAALELTPADVNVKGKRTEGLGGLADGRGIGCHAVALLVPREEAG